MLSSGIERNVFNGFEYDIQFGMNEFAEVGDNWVRGDWPILVGRNKAKFQFIGFHLRELEGEGVQILPQKRLAQSRRRANAFRKPKELVLPARNISDQRKVAAAGAGGQKFRGIALFIANQRQGSVVKRRDNNAARLTWLTRFPIGGQNFQRTPFQD